MPAPLRVDREAVRTLVVAVGVREAARQMGLPESTVQAWSARGKWTAKVKAAQQIAIERVEPQTSLQPSATSPADSLASALAIQSDKIKAGFSKAALKVAEHAPTLDAGTLIDKDTAQSLRHWSGIASTVHGWEAKSEGGGRVMINIGILNE